MKHFLIFLFLIAGLGAAAQKKNNRQAQTKKDSLHIHIRALAEHVGDSIVVRWAPGDAVTWLLTQKNGFVLRRKVFTKKEKNVFSLVDSSSVMIHPWKLDAWGNYFKSSHDSLSAIAAQVAYGKTITLDNGKQGNSFNNISEKYNEQQNRFAFALMLADFDPAVANGLGFRFVEKQAKKDLYYLYSIVPAAISKNVYVDTGRVLLNGAQITARKNFPAVAAVPGDKIIKLFWDNHAAINPFSGYIVEKSDDGKNFRRINRLPFVSFKTGRDANKPVEFSDSVTEDYKNYYYRVSGINAFGDISNPSAVITVHAVDLTPPHYPIISSIKAISTNGHIQLQWIKKEKEKDFKGYVVGRSSNLNGPYEPITKDYLPFGTTSFTDENPSGGAANFYIVAAVDTAGNAGRSMPAYMNVDDHTPPAQPVGLAGNIDSVGRVTVHWKWGKETDLAGYKIFFSNAPDHKFTPLCKDLLVDTVFNDSITLKTLTKKIYYKVIAYDRSMNPSPASAILTLNKPDKIAPVAAIIRTFKVTDSGVVIKWFPSPSNDAAQQLLYRKQDTSSVWVLLSKLTVKDTLFVDRQVSSRHKYIYAIETIDSSGLHSDKSFPLRVYVYDKGYSGAITGFEVTQAQPKNNVRLHWVAPAGEISYYILYKNKDKSGLKMAGNIRGSDSQFEDKTAPGNYQYAIKAVYKNGGESALSEIKTIQVQ